MKAMEIKVCGLTVPGQIAELQTCVQYVGFNFYPPSSRFLRLPPEALPATEGAKRVGVFVDEQPSEILETARRYALDGVQLHGSETPEYVATLGRRLEPETLIIKAVGIAAAADFKDCTRYDDSGADILLLDTASAAHGGSGRHFDWHLLEHYDSQLPFLLAGGIAPGDAATLSALRHPQLRGLDINSRFETAAGVKNIPMIREFISQLRDYEQD